MAKYTLKYFNSESRAEVIRLVLAAAGVKYNDVRISYEEWPAVKPNTPFGQLPVLEIDGGPTLCQSLVIAGYLAKEYGLSGKNELESTQCAMIRACLNDLGHGLADIFFEKDEAKKGEIRAKLGGELPAHLEKLNKMIQANGHFVGDTLTWADIAFFQSMNSHRNFGVKVDLSPFPNLNKCCEVVAANPGIAKWLKEKPKTKF